jgi:hypothetical protein
MLIKTKEWWEGSGLLTWQIMKVNVAYNYYSFLNIFLNFLSCHNQPFKIHTLSNVFENLLWVDLLLFQQYNFVGYGPFILVESTDVFEDIPGFYIYYNLILKFWVFFIYILSWFVCSTWEIIQIIYLKLFLTYYYLFVVAFKEKII